jgi:hypothetical protein
LLQQSASLLLLPQLASKNNRFMAKVLLMSLHDNTTSQSVLNSPAADT